MYACKKVETDTSVRPVYGLSHCADNVRRPICHDNATEQTDRGDGGGDRPYIDESGQPYRRSQFCHIFR